MPRERRRRGAGSLAGTMLAPSQELEWGAKARGGLGEWGGERAKKGEVTAVSLPGCAHTLLWPVPEAV